MTMVLWFCLKSPNFVELYTEVFLEEMITLLESGLSSARCPGSWRLEQRTERDIEVKHERVK